MGLKEEDYKKIREELDNCVKPLFFFDDDPDGLASFLLLYKYKQEGKGIVVKGPPKVGVEYIKKVEEYGPDKIFILDKPMVDQEFIDEIKVPIIWIDHHPLQENHKIKYFNPRKYDEKNAVPTSELCYHVVKDYEWIAVVGIVSDWYQTQVTKEFSKKNSELLPDVDSPEKALFETKIGEISKIFQFLLKGDTKKVYQSIKILTRIEDPAELLEGETARVKKLLKEYNKIKEEYDYLIEEAKKQANEEKMLVFIYQDNKTSVSGELSNELLYLYPEKTIIVGREKSGYVKGSIRSANNNLPPILDEIIVGIDGYGGGHDHACGFSINKDDWEEFLEKFKEKILED